MIYYKHSNTNEVFAYETEQDRIRFGSNELVAMTPQEVDSHLNKQVNLVPSRVPMRKARKALRAAGLLAQIESALDAIPGPEGEDARDDWEYSSEVHRDNPTLQALSSLIGITEEQLDQLFITADAYQ